MRRSAELRITLIISGNADLINTAGRRNPATEISSFAAARALKLSHTSLRHASGKARL
jgi:hypothetical protein